MGTPDDLRPAQPNAKPASAALPLLVLVARPALALAAQSGLALAFQAKGRPGPFVRAAGWWMVYGSAVDAGCVALLALAAQREGVAFRSAAGLDPRPARGLGAAAVDIAALVPAAVVSQLLARPLSPDPADPYPAQIRASRLTGLARAYSLTAWPALWAACEEATYLGYALPRLESRFGGSRAAALVTLAWAAQHAVMPALPGRRYALSRVLTMLPVSAAFTWVYLARGRRMAPLIVAHWALDASAAVLAASLAGKSGRARERR